MLRDPLEEIEMGSRERVHYGADGVETSIQILHLCFVSLLAHVIVYCALFTAYWTLLLPRNTSG
jgi:hypothetical protein